MPLPDEDVLRDGLQIGNERFITAYRKAERELRDFILSRAPPGGEKDISMTDLLVMYAATRNAVAALRFSLEKKGMRDEDLAEVDVICNAIVDDRVDEVNRRLDAKRRQSHPP